MGSSQSIHTCSQRSYEGSVQGERRPSGLRAEPFASHRGHSGHGCHTGGDAQARGAPQLQEVQGVPAADHLLVRGRVDRAFGVSGRQRTCGPPEDVAAYLEDRSETGARPSTLRVAAFAIARNHEAAGFDVRIRYGANRSVLDGLAQDDSPIPARALPLDLDCYLAIRRTGHKPRSGRGGRPEMTATAHRRGAVDVAMIGLVRDASLRVSETAELTWEDIERVRGGSGLVRVTGTGETATASSSSSNQHKKVRFSWAVDLDATGVE